MGDSPDYMQSVSRAPIQALPYQIYGVVSVIASAVAAGVRGTLIWNVPNDGKHYVFDTLFATWTIKGVTVLDVSIAPDQAAPAWAVVAESCKDYCDTLVMSRQGALSLVYPQAVRVRVYNTNAVAREFSVYINEYSY